MRAVLTPPRLDPCPAPASGSARNPPAAPAPGGRVGTHPQDAGEGWGVGCAWAPRKKPRAGGVPRPRSLQDPPPGPPGPPQPHSHRHLLLRHVALLDPPLLAPGPVWPLRGRDVLPCGGGGHRGHLRVAAGTLWGLCATPGSPGTPPGVTQSPQDTPHTPLGPPLGTPQGLRTPPGPGHPTGVTERLQDTPPLHTGSASGDPREPLPPTRDPETPPTPLRHLHRGPRGGSAHPWEPRTPLGGHREAAGHPLLASPGTPGHPTELPPPRD